MPPRKAALGGCVDLSMGLGIGRLPTCYSLVAPASMPLTRVRCAKRKMISTGMIAMSVAIARSGRKISEPAYPEAVGLKIGDELIRTCRPIVTGYCELSEVITNGR